MTIPFLILLSATGVISVEIGSLHGQSWSTRIQNDKKMNLPDEMIQGN